MRADGIELTYGTACMYNCDVMVITGIQERNCDPKRVKTRGIARRERRQIFWSDTMLDIAAEMKDRLKASELLGRSEKDFVDKIEHSIGDDLAEAILKARDRKSKSKKKKGGYLS